MDNSPLRSELSTDLDPAAQHDLPGYTLEKCIEEEPSEIDEYISSGERDNKFRVPQPTLEKVSKGVCKVVLDNGQEKGTGFLAKFAAFNGKWLYGLFTNNHVVSEGNLADDKTFTIQFDAVPDGADGTKFVETVSTTGTFRFTCPILDVTFVLFEDEACKRLSSKGCQFLDIALDWDGKKDKPLFVLQYPESNGRTLCCADGAFFQNYGFNMFHLVSTDSGSSGSPVALFDGMVIGIHKAAPINCDSEYNIAVAMKAVVDAIKPFFCLKYITQVFCNYVTIHQAYAAKLLKFGLRKCRLERDSKFQLMYVSETEVSTWYIPTSHGWYWTETNPLVNGANWMSVSQHKVVGGDWDGKMATQKEIVIINWLFQHNIVGGNCPTEVIDI